MARRETPQRFFPIWQSILRFDLNRSEILVHAYLSSWFMQNGTDDCHTSIAKIGQETSLSRTSVKEAVRGLRKRGLLKVLYVQDPKDPTRNLPNQYIPLVEPSSYTGDELTKDDETPKAGKAAILAFKGRR